MPTKRKSPKGKKSPSLGANRTASPRGATKRRSPTVRTAKKTTRRGRISPSAISFGNTLGIGSARTPKHPHSQKLRALAPGALEIPLRILRGPVSATLHWSKPAQRMIYVFGDHHENKEGCTSFAKGAAVPPTQIAVEDLLSDFVRDHPSVPMDLFLESWYLKDEARQRSALEERIRSESIGYLFVDTTARFRDCLLVDKSKCPWKNLRAHYADARSQFVFDVVAFDRDRFPEAYRFVKLMRLLQSLGQTLQALRQDKVAWAQASTWRFDDEDLPNARDVADPWAFQFAVMTQLVALGKASKQLSRIAEPGVRQIVQQTLMELFENEAYRIDLSKQMEVVHRLLAGFRSGHPVGPDKPTIDRFLSLVEECVLQSLMGYAMLMDAYLIGRIFKRIDPPVRNAVVYAGDAHANVVRVVLAALGFSEIRFPAVGHQCVDVTAMRFPLFDRDFYDMPPIRKLDRFAPRQARA